MSILIKGLILLVLMWERVGFCLWIQVMGRREEGKELIMSVDGEDTRWMCGSSGVVNLHRVSSMVREIGEPCLYHSPAKVGHLELVETLTSHKPSCFTCC